MIRLILKGASDSFVDEVRKELPEGQALVAKWDRPISRDIQHKFAADGVILYGSDEESRQSPMFAGLLDYTVLSRVKADIEYTANRRGFFKNRFPANYVGRVHDDPVNLIIGDPEGFTIKPFLENLPESWWGPIGFITEYNPRKILSICEMHLPYSKPIAISKLAVDALKAARLDFVDATEYPFTKEGGLRLQAATMRDPLP